MKSELLIAWALLRGRRRQNMAIGLTLAACGLLVTTALVVLHGAEQPFVEMFRAQRASHLLLVFDARLHDPSAIAGWWRRQDGVLGVNGPLPIVTTSQNLMVHGAEQAALLHLTEYRAHPDQDQLRIVDGARAVEPGPDEIWLPTAFAAAQQLAVGDRLELPVASGLHPVTVSAIVVDPQFSNAFTNPVRVWLRAGSLAGLFPSGRLDGCMLGVRFADPARGDALWPAFTEFVGGAFTGQAISYATMAVANQLVAQLVAAILLLCGVIALLVALLVIRTTLQGAILADYRQIGILRTLGLTPRQVSAAYLLQSAALACVSVPLGAGCGLLTGRAARAELLRTIAVTGSDESTTLIALAASLLLIAIVAGSVIGAAWRAGQVKPVAAIRDGAPPTRGQVRPPAGRWRWLPVVPLLAQRSLLVPRRRAALAATVIGATVFVLLFAVNLFATLFSLRDDLSQWGFDRAEVRLVRAGKRTALEHRALVESIVREPGVAAVLGVEFMVDGALPPQSGRPARNLLGTVVDGDFAVAGFAIQSGRNPASADEVALAATTAAERAAFIGQPIELFVQGAPLKLTVSGVYRSAQNLGHGFRIQAALLRAIDPLYQPTSYGVRLAPGVERDAFIERVEARYGEAIDAQRGDAFIAAAIRNVVNTIGLALGFVVLVFALVCATAIYNNTVLDVAEQRRVLGILKAVGLTPRQLRWIQVFKAGLLAALATVVGGALWLGLARMLLDPIFGAVGLVRFPLRTTLVGSLLVSLLALALCGASAWLAAARSSRLDVRTLVVE